MNNIDQKIADEVKRYLKLPDEYGFALNLIHGLKYEVESYNFVKPMLIGNEIEVLKSISSDKNGGYCY